MRDLKSVAAMVTCLPVLILAKSIMAEAPTVVTGSLSSFTSDALLSSIHWCLDQPSSWPSLSIFSCLCFTFPFSRLTFLSFYFAFIPFGFLFFHLTFFNSSSLDDSELESISEALSNSESEELSLELGTSFFFLFFTGGINFFSGLDSVTLVSSSLEDDDSYTHFLAFL